LRIDTRVKNANDLGLPFIVTEFGACLDSDACVEEVSYVAEACDRHRVGWAYWQFKNYGDFTTSAGTGSQGFYNNDEKKTLQVRKVKAMARTYLLYTQGVLNHMNFNRKNG